MKFFVGEKKRKIIDNDFPSVLHLQAEEIRKGSVMAQRTKRSVTITDVATHAGVSLGTVSRVMNHHAGVDARLKLRVIHAAQELGYVHRVRRVSQEEVKSEGQRETKSRTLAFYWPSPQILDFSSSQYFALMLQGIESECQRQSFGRSQIGRMLQHGNEPGELQEQWRLNQLVFLDHVDELGRIKTALRDANAEAVLLFYFTDRQLVEGLLELQIPVVVIDHYFANLGVDVVMDDSYHGALHAMEHLLSCGHQRIAFIGSHPIYPIQRRLEAYQLALQHAQLPFDPTCVIAGNLAIDGGIRASYEFVRRNLGCSAILCANDLTALGVMQGLTQQGIQIPEEVSIIGFDDIEPARLISPPLTTVRAYAAQVGQMAVIKAMERLANPSLPVTQTLVHSDLVIRESVLQIAVSSLQYP